MRNLFKLDTLLILFIAGATAVCVGAIVFLFLPAGDLQQQCTILHSDADEAIRNGDYAKAEQLSQAAVRTAEPSGDRVLLAKAYEDLAAAYLADKKLDQSERAVRKGLRTTGEIDPNLQVKRPIVEVHTRLTITLADVLASQGKSDEAVALYKDTLNGPISSLLTVNDKAIVSKSFYALLTKLGRKEEAEILADFSDEENRGMSFQKTAFETLHDNKIELATQMFRTFYNNGLAKNNAQNLACGITMLAICKFNGEDPVKYRNMASSGLAFSDGIKGALDKQAEVSRALSVLSVCNELTGDTKLAEHQLAQAISGDWDTADWSLTDIVRVSQRSGQQKTIDAVDKLLCRVIPQCKDRDSRPILERINGYFEMIGQIEPALHQAKQLVAICERTGGADGKEVLLNEQRIAGMYLAEHKIQEAMPIYLQVIAKWRKLGEDGDTYSQTTAMAQALSEHGYLQESAEIWQTLITMLEKGNKGAMNARIAEADCGLAKTMRLMHRDSESRKLLEQALTYYQQKNDQAGVIATLEQLSEMCEAQNDRAGALAFSRQLLQKYAAIPKESAVRDALSTNAAFAYTRLGQYAAAEAALAHAMKYGKPPALEAARARYHLMMTCLIQQNKLADANVTLKNLQQLLQDGLPSNSREMAMEWLYLADCSHQLKEYAQATGQYESALRTFKVLDGVQSNSAATILNRMADNFRDYRKYSDAQDCYRQALAIYKLRKNNSAAADIGASLASCLKLSGSQTDVPSAK